MIRVHNPDFSLEQRLVWLVVIDEPHEHFDLAHIQLIVKVDVVGGERGPEAHDAKEFILTDYILPFVCEDVHEALAYLCRHVVELSVKRCLESASFHEKITKIVDSNVLKKPLPPFIFCLENPLCANDGLDPAVSKDEILYLHAIIYVALQLLIFDDT